MAHSENLEVSVIVQTYNHVRYISQCLEGILNQQTSFKFEIILGEDESNDGTTKICQEYHKKFPKQIKLYLRKRNDVIHINDQPTGRFNLISNIREAKGQFIAICEGDDFWTDRFKLQKQVDFLKLNPDKVAVFHNVNIIHERRKLFRNNIFLTRRLKSQEFNFRNLVRMSWIIPTCSLMFRSNAITEFPSWFYEIINGDIGLAAILGKKGSFYYMEAVMGTYRIHNSGITRNISGSNAYFNLSNTWLTINKYYNNQLNQEIKITLEDIYFRGLVRLAINKPHKFTHAIIKKILNEFNPVFQTYRP